jgi:hypothetical protein
MMQGIRAEEVIRVRIRKERPGIRKDEVRCFVEVRNKKGRGRKRETER